MQFNPIRIKIRNSHEIVGITEPFYFPSFRNRYNDRIYFKMNFVHFQQQQKTNKIESTDFLPLIFTQNGFDNSRVQN